MADIELKRKEVKTITFTYSSGVSSVDIDNSTLTFVIKLEEDSKDALVTIEDADFDKTQSATKIVTCVLTAIHTDIVGNFFAELKTEFTSTNIDKSPTWTVFIDESLTI